MRIHTYDVVIATKDRSKALALSIPLLLKQSRLPEKIIVVDASGDGAAVKAVVEGCRAQSIIPIELLRSQPGSSLQRNIGLQHVTSDVVLFPDDDSLVLPGALESMMRIYDRDKLGHIGGVCSAEATQAPVDLRVTAEKSYKLSVLDQIKQIIGRPLYATERILMRNPFLLHGRSKWRGKDAPDWLAEENAVLVEYMTGFRMSFRVEVLRRYGFSEVLGTYAFGEDVDASFCILRTHLLVGARNARIYHHRIPGSRSSDRAMGVMNILNTGFIIARHSEPDSPARRAIFRFCLFKILQFAIQSMNFADASRASGALAAYRRLPILLNAQTSQLEETYRRLYEECMQCGQ